MYKENRAIVTWLSENVIAIVTWLGVNVIAIVASLSENVILSVAKNLISEQEIKSGNYAKVKKRFFITLRFIQNDKSTSG